MSPGQFLNTSNLNHQFVSHTHQNLSSLADENTSEGVLHAVHQLDCLDPRSSDTGITIDPSNKDSKSNTGLPLSLKKKKKVLMDACWALTYLSDGTNDKTQAVKIAPSLRWMQTMSVDLSVGFIHLLIQLLTPASCILGHTLLPWDY